jgi:hypothetical protein
VTKNNRYLIHLIAPDMLPRLTELTCDLPSLFAEGGEEPETGLHCEREMAGGSPVELVNQMAAVCHSYETARRLVQSQDELLERTMASLGRL